VKKNTVYEARDIFVRFRDLLLYVLLRWKSVLLVALAVAVLATGIKFWQDTNRYNAIEKAKTAAEEPEEEPLDDDGKAHVELVKWHQKNYESLREYNLTAPMMKINFQAVHTYRLNYLITGNNSFVTATLLEDSLQDEMLYSALTERFSVEENAHLAELVTITIKEDAAEYSNAKVVELVVIAPTKEMCEAITDVVREMADAVNKKIQREVGGSYGRWEFDEYGVVTREEVKTLQKEKLTAQDKAREELEKATESLTTAEEDYLFVRDKEEEPTLTYPNPTVSKTTLILGFVGGVLLMALWHGLRYLYCGRVLSSVELSVRHDLPAFGALAGTKKRFIVDRWLRRWLQEEDSADFLLWHRMALTAKNAGIRSVYLVGDPARLEGLTDVMEQQGVTLHIGDSPLSAPEALASLAQAEAVILTADLEVTRHKTVAAELELAEQLGCKPLGALLIKE